LEDRQVTVGRPLGSVVIPAHNEAAVIARCLDALLAGFQPGELDVVVSCNGCTDRTADIVRSGGRQVRVLEIETASKSAALRAADATTGLFPRLYLDADVILASGAARCVLGCLTSGAAPAARPPISYNTDDSSPVVRSYYRARARVPAVMNSLWGAGVYGLSAEGRSRFREFPDLMGDDLFVDQHFEREEIAIVDASPVVVNAPRRAADMLRILRRAYQGNAQNRSLAGSRPQRTGTTGGTTRDLVRLALREPARMADVSVYVALALLARATLTAGSSHTWERDDSSRVTTQPTDDLSQLGGKAPS
jgi:Glycosyl transferase family 2